jgi:hypothetical protein
MQIDKGENYLEIDEKRIYLSYIKSMQCDDKALAERITKLGIKCEWEKNQENSLPIRCEKDSLIDEGELPNRFRKDFF